MSGCIVNELKKHLRNGKVLVEGEIKSYSEAGALLIKRMIEEDLPKSVYFPENEDPYKWLAGLTDKNERTLRGWAYDWNSPSGKKLTIQDFFRLVSVIGPGRSIELLENLGRQLTPEEQSQQCEREFS